MAARSGLFMCCVGILLLYITGCFSLYEDQVGMFDWRQSFIGKVKFAHFDLSTHSSKRLFVATESNVLASLNSRTRAIIWRHVFEEEEGQIEALLHRSSYLISVSGGGRFVRSWDPNSGNLIWENIGKNTRDVDGDQKGTIKPLRINVDAIFASTGKKEDVLVLWFENTLKAYSLLDGSEMWSAVSQDTNDKFAMHHLQAFDSQVVTISKHDDVRIAVKKFSADSGNVVGENILPAEWSTQKNDDCIIVLQKNLICFDSKSSNLQVMSIDDDSKLINTIPLSTLSVDDIAFNQPQLQSLGSHTTSWKDRPEFVLQLSSNHHLLLELKHDLSVGLIKQFTDNVKLFASVLGDNAILVSMVNTGSTLEFQCFDLSKRKQISEMGQRFKLPEHHGKPEKAILYLFSKKEGVGYRVLLVTSDHALILVQQPGRITWLREEALAMITATEIVELPFSPSQANFETLQEEFGAHPNDDILSRFLRRIRAQVKQFQHFAASLNAQREHGFMTEMPSSEEEKLTRDQFNIRKIIVAVTKAGKLFGLDSSDGSIVWRYYLPNLAPFVHSTHVFSVLYEQRTVAHFPLPAQCMVLGQSQSSDGSMVYVFNPITGKPVGASPRTGTVLPYKVLQSMILPHTDKKHAKIVLLLDSTLKVHVFPNTKETMKIITSKASSIFFFVTNKETGNMKGYMLQVTPGSDELHAQEMWNVHIPPDQQIITNIATKRIGEHVHSLGKVLGDRNVLYKYLNPNLVMVGTVATAGSKPTVSIYFIDAITGLVIFHARHKNARGPLHMVHSEHWAVYSLYNTKSRRYEVSVVELYEGYKERNHTAFSSLDPPPQPMVLRQSYIFPTTIRTLSITTTERGITHRNLLFGLQMGYVFSLPKNYLDPRRSFTVTQEDREEGLMPYVPEIPVSAQAFINYNQTVANIEGIHTVGAGLESTCLVFTYGLDLFYTRVTPSRMFDVLKDDFDYWFIAGTLGVLVIVTFLSQRLAAVKMLKQMWQ